MKELRIDRGWTQERLASESGVHPHTIIRAEQGLRISDLNQGAIARALGVDRRELFAEPEEATA